MLSFQLLKLISTRTTFAIGGSVYKRVCALICVFNIKMHATVLIWAVSVQPLRCGQLLYVDKMFGPSVS